MSADSFARTYSHLLLRASAQRRPQTWWSSATKTMTARSDMLHLHVVDVVVVAAAGAISDFEQRFRFRCEEDLTDGGRRGTGCESPKPERNLSFAEEFGCCSRRFNYAACLRCLSVQRADLSAARQACAFRRGTPFAVLLYNFSTSFTMPAS